MIKLQKKEEKKYRNIMHMFMYSNTHTHTLICHNTEPLTGDVQGVDLAFKVPRSRSDCASMGYNGQTNPIHGGLNSQLTGLKESTANI